MDTVACQEDLDVAHDSLKKVPCFLFVRVNLLEHRRRRLSVADVLHQDGIVGSLDRLRDVGAGIVRPT